MNELYTYPSSVYINEDFVASTLYFIVLSIFIFLFSYNIKDGSQKKVFLLFSIGLFILKFFLIITNEQVHILESKKAGNFALWYYIDIKQQGFFTWLKQAENNYTFYPQVFANYLPFEIFGASRINLLLSNAFSTSLVGIMVFFSIRRWFDEKKAWIGFLIFSLFPAACCFSIFGLRDSITFFFTTAYALCIVKVIKYNTFSIKDIVIYITIIFFLLLSRPESASYQFIPVFGCFFYQFVQTQKSYFKTKIGQSLITIFFVFLFGIMMVALYSFVCLNYSYGTKKVVAPNTFVETYMRQHYEPLHHRDRESSNILSPNKYTQTHWFLKWSLQTTGIIICPLPHLVNDKRKLMVFFESILLLAILLFTIFNQPCDDKQNHLRVLLLAIYILGILIFGILVSNAGNAFRIRLNLVPFLFLAFLMPNQVSDNFSLFKLNLHDKKS